jgi:hypothetical protein
MRSSNSEPHITTANTPQKNLPIELASVGQVDLWVFAYHV